MMMMPVAMAGQQGQQMMMMPMANQQGQQMMMMPMGMANASQEQNSMPKPPLNGPPGQLSQATPPGHLSKVPPGQLNHGKASASEQAKQIASDEKSQADETR